MSLKKKTLYHSQKVWNNLKKLLPQAHKIDKAWCAQGIIFFDWQNDKALITILSWFIWFQTILGRDALQTASLEV